jgi:hypothetical protein
MRQSSGPREGAAVGMPGTAAFRFSGDRVRAAMGSNGFTWEAFCRPSGASGRGGRRNPGLTPWATYRRPGRGSGAETGRGRGARRRMRPPTGVGGSDRRRFQNPPDGIGTTSGASPRRGVRWRVPCSSRSVSMPSLPGPSSAHLRCPPPTGVGGSDRRRFQNPRDGIGTKSGAGLRRGARCRVPCASRSVCMPPLPGASSTHLRCPPPTGVGF